MPKNNLRLRSIGPILDADVAFGDLTILVGPQATGKSIFLQFLKLMLDAGPVLGYFNEHGLNWHKDTRNFLELYLGEGTGELWQRGQSGIEWQGEPVDLERFIRSNKGHRSEERSFLIPAQRVMAFSRDGWFRPFNDYRAGDPFSIRDFSEKLRRLMESDTSSAGAIYPQPRKLKAEIRKMISRTIFGGFELELEKTGPQKRLVLHRHDTQIPYMVWSAGQREFVPLLLGLYRLLPSTMVKRAGPIKWVMIEELEMGLHPEAIASMFFIILELMWRGYSVCLSTHSPLVLDLAWALGHLRRHRSGPATVLSLFDVTRTRATMEVAKAALMKKTKVYYFNPDSRSTDDISSLDPAASEIVEAGWGGLSGITGRVNDIVATAVAADCGK